MTGVMPASRHADATVLPMKPAPPAMRTFTGMNLTDRRWPAVAAVGCGVGHPAVLVTGE